MHTHFQLPLGTPAAPRALTTQLRGKKAPVSRCSAWRQVRELDMIKSYHQQHKAVKWWS